MSSGLTLVVPVYNEEEALESFLPGLLGFCVAGGHRAILVDDGSTDSSGTLLKEASRREEVTVVANKVNRGYGGAVKAGIKKVETEYVVTMDADGQHRFEDVDRLLSEIRETDSDMIVGGRSQSSGESRYRRLGKRLIRFIAGLLMPLPVRDLNSGMKIYRTELAKRHLHLCPDSMAYSDIITLVFINQGYLVMEIPISIEPRLAGASTITTMTALETVMEIINIVVLFNPMRIFLPLALLLILAGVGWGLPIVLRGRGVSIGAMLSVVSGLILFFLALIAEQLSSIRRSQPPIDV